MELITRGMALAAALLSVGAAQGQITSGLVTHLKFDNSYTDSSGNNVNGTPVGQPGFTGGIIGSGALMFSSVPAESSFNYVTLGSPAPLQFGTATDFSYSFWTKFSQWSADPPLIANKSWSSGNTVGYVIATGANGRLQWNYREQSATAVRQDYDGPGNTLSGGGWHHVAVTFDRDGSARTYLDGVLVDSRTIASPAASTIDTGQPTNIGQDATGAYAGNALIRDGAMDDLGIWRRVLTADEVTRIYEAGLEGKDLSQAVEPAGVTIASISPGDESLVGPGAVFEAVLVNGTETSLNPASVRVLLNGSAVAHSIQTAGRTNTIRYDAPGLFAPESDHEFTLVYSDTGTPAVTVTNTVSFTVVDYEDATLPTPFLIETFEGAPLGGVPAGWTVQNYTDSIIAGTDLADPQSDSYLGWVVISTDIVAENEADGDWLAGRRLATPLELVVNGEQVESLLSGKFLYAESESRSGNQVQIVTTPDFDFTGRTDVHLAFHSAYEQAPNSIALVEYSVDQGNLWYPLLYMLDVNDVVLFQGVPNAFLTFNEWRADQPYFEDFETGEFGSGEYRYFLKAPLDENLAPHISGEIADDPLGSKRIEVLSMPLAANQPAVRLRFVHAGRTSWYWGIDDVAFYSIPPTGGLPRLTIQESAQGVTILVSGSGQFQLQGKASLNDPTWENIGAPSATGSFSVATGNPMQFFRVLKVE